MESLQIQDAFEPYYQGRKEPFEAERAKRAAKPDVKTSKASEDRAEKPQAPAQGKH